MINPYHIQPGILLDVDIISIKRKKATLSGMANVLNEFLHGVSKGFQDAAFASYSRRRSTIREDIDQNFGGASGTHKAEDKAASAYLDILNDGSAPAAIEAPKAGSAAKKTAPAGAAVKVPGKRGRKPGSGRKK
jgi:hypothetical protein